ncbi:MAG: hypothetical protein H3C69_08760 [Candidatus Promineofilum sp.]|nr:hypothetical protein [Promineifilum sp.]
MLKRKSTPTAAPVADRYEQAIQQARDLVEEYKANAAPLHAAYKDAQRAHAALVAERESLAQTLKEFDAGNSNPFTSTDEYTAALFRFRSLPALIQDAYKAEDDAQDSYMRVVWAKEGAVETLMQDTLKEIDTRRAELKAEFDALRFTR